MQSILSRIWTRVAMSISYDNNHYTTGTTSKFSFYGNSTFKSEITSQKFKFILLPMISYV